MALDGNMNSLMGVVRQIVGSANGPSPQPYAKETAGEDPQPSGEYDDDSLLELWTQFKRESLEDRWVFERQWHRNILYVLGRQWIEYFSRQGGWKDKRLPSWVPRPVTNKAKETVQSIRAVFTAINFAVNVRPNGASPANVAAANVADEISPFVYDNHNMDDVMTEFDFWLITTGNAFLHAYLDYDFKNGVLNIPMEECQACGYQVGSDQLAGPNPTCPHCGAQGPFVPAMDEDENPALIGMPKGVPKTTALSPLEIAFPNSYARFADLPYVIRLRWRPKSYFQSHPELQKQFATASWEKTPSNQTLSLFKSLANMNDLGVTASYMTEGASGSNDEEGLPEYEVWMKPTEAYPKGLVFRVIGDKQPIIAHAEETEALPGPLPYTDVKGRPLFPFAHSTFEQVGGRILGSGPIDVMIQKQDQLNQLDSMVLLIINRMSNPVWVYPKGSEIQKITGIPGQHIEWNPLTVGGNAKPERMAGIGPDQSLFEYRAQLLKDIEELTGTFDIIKGAKPTGVEAFSALQLLVERSQSRFSTVFKSRAKAQRDWYKLALELQREFGDDEMVMAVMTPARKWTFKMFKRADLQGDVAVIVEDGSAVPKTSLGIRAAMEQANQLQMLNMQDPDQRYEGLKLFGLTKLAPSLDIHVQSALQKQDAFEEWAGNNAAMLMSYQKTEQDVAKYEAALAQTQDIDLLGPPPSPLDNMPLQWMPWWNASIHKQEFLKWANGDSVRELLAKNPGLKNILATHLGEIDQHLSEQAMQNSLLTNPPRPNLGGAAPQGAGGAQAMKNSNNESTKGNEPKGNGQGAQNQGPA